MQKTEAYTVGSFEHTSEGDLSSVEPPTSTQSTDDLYSLNPGENSQVVFPSEQLTSNPPETLGNVSLGERLKQLMKEKGLSRSDLARLMNTDRRNVGRWVTGECVPEPYNLRRLAKILDVSLKELSDLAELEKQQNRAPWEYRTLQNLPFIGRDEDIQKILAKLLNEHFCAITGTIGVGKSELARQVVEVAKRTEHFLYIKIDLEDYINTEVALRVLRQLPPHTLVKLENCEYVKHLIDFTEELYNLLEEHTQLYILATSRVSMNRPADYPIQPLKIDEAVQLFFDAAEKIGKALTYNDAPKAKVEELCELLDRLPLALQLDAGLLINDPFEEVYHWTKETFDEMSNRTKETSLLDAEIPISESVRHRTTLQKLFEKHYQSLGENAEDEQEGQQLQALFRRLAIFVAPCRMEAVQAVCIIKNDLPEQEHKLRNLLRELALHYLITYENGWIAILHKLLREFASRKLNDNKNKEEVSEVMRKFIDYYKNLVAEYMEQQFNTEELEITKYLESENKSFDNFSYAYKIDCIISPLFPFIKKRVKVRLGEEYENIQEPLSKYISKKKTTDFSDASEEIKERHEKWCQVVEEVCKQKQDLINNYPSLDLWQKFWIEVKKSDMVSLSGLYKTYGLL